MDTTHRIIRTISISALRANVLTILIFVPYYLLMMFLFVLIWDKGTYESGIHIIKTNLPLTLLVFVIGIILHEGIHGLTWAIFAPNGLKSIKYGIKWLYLMPYCHCNQTMKRNYFILGVIMPGLLLGIIPTIIGFFNANAWISIAGIIFTGAAGGDFIIAYILFKVKKKYYIEDHPDEIGFIIRSN